MERREAVVIGTGMAGVGAAAMLRRRGFDVLSLERSDSIGASWRARYDRLHLNTLGWLSALPGQRFPRRHGPYPSRAAVIEYLEAYAARCDLDIRFRTEAARLERASAGWTVHVRDREPVSAGWVVVATGFDREPVIPAWPGRERFSGEIAHGAHYRNAQPYQGKDVLVVGAGNTASDLVTDLVEGGAGRVRIAIRTPPNIFPRRVNGLPLQYSAFVYELLPPRLFDMSGFFIQRLLYGDLSKHGLPRAPEGVQSHFLATCHGPMVDEGFVRALKAGKVEVLPAVECFEGDDVVLVDGRRIQPEAVLAGTGYRRALDPLVGHLGVLTHTGSPAVHGAETHADAPGLYFIGFISRISGQLRLMRGDARRIAQAVARERDGARPFVRVPKPAGRFSASRRTGRRSGLAALP